MIRLVLNLFALHGLFPLIIVRNLLLDDTCYKALRVRVMVDFLELTDRSNSKEDLGFL